MSTQSLSQFNCVFASGLTVEDRSLLSTLTLFYDKVYLPHPYDLDPEQKPLIRWPGKYWRDLELEQNRYRQWIETYRMFFDERVLEVLSPAIALDADRPADLAERLRDELGIQIPYFTRGLVFSGRLALSVHALYASTSAPEFLITSRENTSTSHLRSSLATMLLEYRLPQIRELEPEQILHLRDEVAPFKQGFINYLSQFWAFGDFLSETRDRCRAKSSINIRYEMVGSRPVKPG
jgi:hypothetical protein